MNASGRCWPPPYDEARYEAALRQAGSPVVALFDRVELGKSPWKTPAKKTNKPVDGLPQR
ncbi:MAG: hypothetical protein MUF81_11710 [Verrucomicrobia bacterium]|nr:hypothetical protein [Verrucomicrobiota bacterium]